MLSVLSSHIFQISLLDHLGLYSHGTSECEKRALCYSTDLSACWPFATAITHIGFLSSVLADVSNEWAGLGEGLATDHTDTRLLSCKTWITVSPWWDVDEWMNDDVEYVLPSRSIAWMSWEHLCGCVHAAAMLQGHWKLSDSAYRCTVSPHCELAGVSSDFLKSRYHHTKVRPNASKRRQSYRSQLPLSS